MNRSNNTKKQCNWIASKMSSGLIMKALLRAEMQEGNFIGLREANNGCQVRGEI